MNNFKVTFLTGYKGIEDIYNDNDDIHIILESGDVYCGSIITPDNLKVLMRNNNLSHMWMTDMFVVKDLKKETIRNAIQETLDDNSFERIFIKIGDIAKIYSGLSYEEITDMNDLLTDNL